MFTSAKDLFAIAKVKDLAIKAALAERDNKEVENLVTRWTSDIEETNIAVAKRGYSCAESVLWVGDLEQSPWLKKCGIMAAELLSKELQQAGMVSVRIEYTWEQEQVSFVCDWNLEKLINDPTQHSFWKEL